MTAGAHFTYIYPVIENAACEPPEYGCAAVTLSANEMSITSRVHQHVPATWLSLTLDPHETLLKYWLWPKHPETTLQVSLSLHALFDAAIHRALVA